MKSVKRYALNTRGYHVFLVRLDGSIRIFWRAEPYEIAIGFRISRVSFELEFGLASIALRVTGYSADRTYGNRYIAGFFWPWVWYLCFLERQWPLFWYVEHFTVS